QLVRVNLTLGGPKDSPGTAGVTVTRIIAVPSQTMPAQVQAPGMNIATPRPRNGLGTVTQ
ncbi:MAG TPA: hypothetical protein VN625_05900, partial [Desulfuromonadaceae bacterium]|nr:hypothetical protein [Desulfuromonadaceae bacterium]